VSSPSAVDMVHSQAESSVPGALSVKLKYRGLDTGSCPAGLVPPSDTGGFSALRASLFSRSGLLGSIFPPSPKHARSSKSFPPSPNRLRATLGLQPKRKSHRKQSTTGQNRTSKGRLPQHSRQWCLMARTADFGLRGESASGRSITGGCLRSTSIFDTNNCDFRIRPLAVGGGACGSPLEVPLRSPTTASDTNFEIRRVSIFCPGGPLG
jgi:hypothetical protein